MGVNDLHKIMAGREEHQDWPPSSIEKIHELAQSDSGLAKEKDDRSGWTPLHYGMKYGASGSAVQAVMAVYPKAADVVDNNGHTPLDLGLQEGAPADAIKELLDAYPSAAKAIDDSGRTYLHLAIHYGRVSGEAIKFVLKARPQSAKAVDSDLRTPLHLCMKKDAPPDAIQAILDAYPKATELEDGNGMTPLHAAVQNGASGDAVQAILDVYPSAAKMEFHDGKFPLYRAIENQASTQAIEALVAAYPEAASIKNNFGRTPLFLCIEKGLPPDTVRVVLEAYPQGAEARDTNGYTALHWSMGYGAPPETIGIIMEAFPEAAGMQDKDGMSPLFVGMEKGVSVSSIMAVLVAYPPAVEMQDNLGSTPLRYGLLKSAPIEIIKAMLEAWPYAASVRDAKGFTPLMIHLRLIYDKDARAEATRQQIDIDTSMLKMIIERYPEAGEVEDVAGLSPISFLISLCLGGNDFASLVCDDTGYRLQLLMKGIRDGRPLKKLCTTQRPVPLQMFFSLFDQSGGLEECQASMMPEIDLNHEHIPGWTLLELLADIDNVEASNIIFQIVEEQKGKLMKGNKDNLITITCQDTKKSTVSFRSVSVVLDETMRRVADRAKLSNSSEKLKLWGEEYGRFMGKYRIDRNERPKHRSYHCVVMFGTELVPSPDGDGRKVEERVALKFEADEDSFAREIQNRQYILDNSEEDGSPFVARIRAAYTTGTKHEEQLRKIPNVYFRKELSRDLAKFDHLLYLNPCDDTQERLKINHLMVMDGGGGDDLGDFISHQDICGKNLFHVLHAGISMARCLQFLNDDCGIVHQDVQPRNFVALENGTDFRAIDLDSAAVVGTVLDDSGPHNRSGYLPPEQALVEYHGLSKGDSLSEGSTDGEASSISIGEKLEELETMLENAPPEYRPFIQKEIDRITGEDEKSQIHHAPELVVAQSQYDMWGFGACLYELCTNKKLFRVDGTDDVVDDEELGKIAAWDTNDMRKALQMVPNDQGWERIKLLLQLLLQPAPSDRPESWRTIVSELEKGSLRENGNVRNLASITPAVLTDVETVNCPFVFQFINEQDFRQFKTDRSAPQDGGASQFQTRLERAQKLLAWASARVEDPTGSPASPSKNVLKMALSKVTGKKEECLYLQLLCGWTLEPVITYQIPIEKYLDRAQMIAMFGAKSCSTGIKLAMSWNSMSRSARMFGYPMPVIPADVVESSTEFLEDLCSSLPVVELNLSNKEEGMIRPHDFTSFARFLEELEGTGKVCHLLDKFEDISGSWEDALKREIVVGEGERPQITFVSVREFARHGGCA